MTNQNTAAKSHDANLPSVLTGKIHEGFTVAADQMVQRGYITQEQRKALSHLIGGSLDYFNANLDPALADVIIDADCADFIASKTAELLIHCPSCETSLVLPKMGWYQCPECGEPLYATERENKLAVVGADDADVAEADIPTELVLAERTEKEDGATTKPYSGVPPALWNRMESCVADVMAKGKDKSAAIAICHVALMGKDTSGKEVSADAVSAAQKDCGCSTDEAHVPAGRPGPISTLIKSLFSRRKDTPPASEHIAPDAPAEMSAGLLWDGGAVDSIFKDAKTGKWRWVLFSSSAYKDADEEIVSRKALERDAERMTDSGNYGPLRWWHVGDPDRATLKAGPGLDIGLCDFSAVHGNIAIESGLFDDDEVGAGFFVHHKDIGASRGFFHPKFEPDEGGVFHNIYTFERSMLPRTKASNHLTQLYVTKEKSMEERKRLALEQILGAEKTASILRGAEAVDESARAAGKQHKAQNEQPDAPVAAVADVVVATPVVETPSAAPIAEVAPAPVPEAVKEAPATTAATQPAPAQVAQAVPIADEEPGGFSEAETAAYKEIVRDTLLDVMRPFLDGLSEASAKQSEQHAKDIAALTKTVNAQAVEVGRLSGHVAELLGDLPPSQLKEMRASTSAETVVGTQDGSGESRFTAGNERYRDAYPAADSIGSFINDFVKAGGGEE